MKIIDSNEDTLNFERAFVARGDSGELVARCFYSGIACEIDATPGALAVGFVAVVPLDEKLKTDWPLSVTLEKENTHGEPYQELMENCTANPSAVSAYRKFLTLLDSNWASPQKVDTEEQF